MPFIIREQGSGTRQVVNEKLLVKLKEVNICMEIESSETIKNMVLADLGIGCLLYHVIKQALISGDLVKLNIKDTKLSRIWWVIWHKKRYQSDLWQCFLGVLEELDNFKV